MVLSFTHLDEFLWRLQRNDPEDESHLVLDGRVLDRMVHKLDFAGDNYIDLIYAARENRTVTKLTLCHYQELHAPLGDLFAKFKNLQALACFDCSPAAVKRLVKMTTRIHELQILCKHPTSEYSSVVASGIRKHPSLERVHFLCQWPEETCNIKASIDEVVLAAATVPNLRLAYFGSRTSGTKLHFNCHKTLKKLLQCPTLCELYLSRYSFSGKDCKVLASSLESQNCSLKLLHLTHLSFERPADSVAIACAFQDNSSVSELCLDHLTDAPTQFYLDLSLAFQISKTLAHVSLDNQGVADGAEQGLLEILMSLKTPGSSLRTISMDGNGFSDELVNSVSYVLRVNFTGGMDAIPKLDDFVGGNIRTICDANNNEDGMSRVSDITECNSRAFSTSSATSDEEQMLPEDMLEDASTSSSPDWNRLSAVKRQNLSSSINRRGLTRASSSRGKGRPIMNQLPAAAMRKGGSCRSLDLARVVPSPESPPQSGQAAQRREKRKPESTAATAEPTTIIYEMCDDSFTTATGSNNNYYTEKGSPIVWGKRTASLDHYLSPALAYNTTNEPSSSSRLTELRRKRNDRENVLRGVLLTSSPSHSVRTIG